MVCGKQPNDARYPTYSYLKCEKEAEHAGLCGTESGNMSWAAGGAFAISDEEYRRQQRGAEEIRRALRR